MSKQSSKKNKIKEPIASYAIDGGAVISDKELKKIEVKIKKEGWLNPEEMKKYVKVKLPRVYRFLYEGRI